MNPRITESEIAIIKEAQRGSQLAFSKLFNHYKHFVETILFGYIKDKDEAKDITNVVFIKVYNKLSKFVDYDSFGGWLRVLTKNTAVDYLRTVKKTKYVDYSSKEVSQMSYKSSESDLTNQLTFDDIFSKLDNLSLFKRQVLTMFYIENYTIVDISKRLQKPVGSIKSVLFRFRKQVFKQLKLNEDANTVHVNPRHHRNLPDCSI